MNRASSATGWVRNPDGTLGYTWNPITGCLNGCEYCYARKLANTRLRERYLANDSYLNVDMPIEAATKAKTLPCYDPFYPRFWEDRLGSPYLQSGEKGIFTCDMSDLFGIGVPEEWTRKVLYQIRLCERRHCFYLLTKQPQNLPAWSPFLDNCKVGVTITNGMKAIEEVGNPLAYLKKVQARVKYISFEPLLRLWDTEAFNCVDRLAEAFSKTGIKWVIIGAQTGTLNDMKKTMFHYPELTLMPYGKKWTLQPRIEWVREIVQATDKAGIPVFLKDNLRPIITERQKPFWYIDHYESHLRQEMPG